MLRHRFCIARRRFFATKNAPKSEIKYTNTINLPKSNFPARLSAEKRADTEERLRKSCFRELYNWQRANRSPVAEFVLHDGPPYANGDLHMGHAVNKVLKDLVLKHKVITGTRVHYVPGWDCHGLPIELKALEQFRRGSEALDARKIRGTARKFALQTIAKQQKEFEQWAVTADWSNADSWYRTLDPAYIKAQLELFFELYEKRLIYRDLKPVFWSPSSQSALAEAELEYDEAHKSPSVYLKLCITAATGCAAIDDRLRNGETVSAVIWTTTPWTLPANQAVCYNPNLRYSLVKSAAGETLLVGHDLVEQLAAQLGQPLESVTTVPGEQLSSLRYRHPIDLHEESMPFFAASHVKAEKGTGLVHTAPAHGPEDFLVFLERKLAIKSLIDENGRYNESSPEFLRGKYALTEGNAMILDKLQQDIIARHTIEHSYPIDWRTKQPVMLRASDQWFINTDQLKDTATNAIEGVNIFPRVSADVSKRTMRGQLQKRPYWCISRQRAWGVPIPVVYVKATMEPIVHRGIVDAIGRRLAVDGTIDFWWSAPVEELVPEHVLQDVGHTHEELIRGNDILDIWFDSGASWLTVLGRQRVADLYLEGLDQFTGWFQSSLLTSVAARGTAPYKAIFVHGFAVDENGAKMSKSLGNIISPKDIVKQYGCDTLRWWVCAHATQNTSIPVSHKLLESSAESVQKLRGILKYLLGVIATRKPSEDEIILEDRLHHIDRYFITELKAFHDGALAHYDSYQHNRATALILNFALSTLSGLYVHLIKDRLYCGTDQQHRQLQSILSHTYQTLCKVLWPILPYLVEESWSYCDDDAFYKQQQPTPPTIVSHPTATEINCALELRHTIFRQDLANVNTWLLDVTLECAESSEHSLLTKLHPTLDIPVADSELTELLQVGSLTLKTAHTAGDRFAVQMNKIERPLCPRCRRFTVQQPDGAVCHRCHLVLQQQQQQQRQ